MRMTVGTLRAAFGAWRCEHVAALKQATLEREEAAREQLRADVLREATEAAQQKLLQARAIEHQLRVERAVGKSLVLWNGKAVRTAFTVWRQECKRAERTRQAETLREVGDKAAAAAVERMKLVEATLAGVQRRLEEEAEREAVLRRVAVERRVRAAFVKWTRDSLRRGFCAWRGEHERLRHAASLASQETALTALQSDMIKAQSAMQAREEAERELQAHQHRVRSRTMIVKPTMKQGR